MSKNLDTKIGKKKDLGRNELACANRHGLDHDRASDGLWTRLDVTICLWKFLRRKRKPGCNMWEMASGLSPAPYQGEGLRATGCKAGDLCKRRKGGASSVMVAPAKVGQPPPHDCP